MILPRPARRMATLALLLVGLLGAPRPAPGQTGDAADSTAVAEPGVGFDASSADPAGAFLPIDALRATPGVHVAALGLGDYVLTLRGRSGLFFGDAPLVLVDGRPASLPALGTNVFGLMPIQRVDLKRVEVERSPAVARYGPAAHAGAIHFVTKNPFDDPGTTVAVSGGTHHYLSGQLRHAADVGGTFGYEATAYLARGTDWRLDPGRAADRRWLTYDYVFDDPRDAHANQHVDPATGRLLRDDAYRRAGIHGRLAYRLDGRTTIAAQGGYASLTARALTEAGTLQADYWGYAFGQLRLRSGGRLAQFVLNDNESGDSYLYGTDAPFVDRSVRYLAEARYRFGALHERANVTLGGAADWTRPRTRYTLMGRHEERDAVNAYGAYARARAALTPRLDASLALRGDVDNLDGRVPLAPHAWLAYALAPSHTLHLRFDRAVAPPRAPERFLDAEVRRQALAGPYAWLHHARGAGDGFTFDTFRRRGEAASLLPLAGQFGRPLPVDALPLAPVYRAAATRFERLLADPTDRPAPVRHLTDAQIQTLAAALQELASEIAPEATTRGELGLPRGAGGYAPVEAPRDVPPLRRPVTQALELGYRGRLGAGMRLRAAAYYVRTKNAVAPLEVAAPAVYAPALVRDAGDVLAPALTDAASDPDASLDALLDAMGMTPTEAARLVAELTDRALDDTPVAVVQPDGALLPPNASPMGVGTLLTYRNVGPVTQAGTELDVRASLTPRLEVDGGLAVAVDASFSDRPAGNAAVRARNAPAFRARLGMGLALSAAWSLHAAAHFASRFAVRAGLYDGTVPAAYPLDLGLRYDPQRYVPGLQLEFTVQNVLNQQRRPFVGAPVLGRMARARLTYAL